MSDEFTLRCDDCNEPIADCGCPPPGHPVEGDLVTEDLRTFYVLGETTIASSFTVDGGGDWKLAVLTWMYCHRDYPNVWMFTGDRYHMLGLDMADDSEEE